MGIPLVQVQIRRWTMLLRRVSMFRGSSGVRLLDIDRCTQNPRVLESSPSGTDNRVALEVVLSVLPLRQGGASEIPPPVWTARCPHGRRR